jgi:hypothetical protein
MFNTTYSIMATTDRIKEIADLDSQETNYAATAKSTV